MEQITTELIRECFGDEFHIKERFFGGWLITAPDGSEIEITRDEQIKEWCGGAKVSRGIVTLAGRAWGRLEVSGPDEFVLACMAWGERLNVMVIPAVKDSGEGCLRMIVAVIALWVVCIAVGLLTDNWIVAVIAALVVSFLIDHAIEKAMERRARREGQKYRSSFPASHDERTASFEEAQKRGYL